MWVRPLGRVAFGWRRRIGRWLDRKFLDRLGHSLCVPRNRRENALAVRELDAGPRAQGRGALRIRPVCNGRRTRARTKSAHEERGTRHAPKMKGPDVSTGGRSGPWLRCCASADGSTTAALPGQKMGIGHEKCDGDGLEIGGRLGRTANAALRVCTCRLGLIAIGRFLRHRCVSNRS